jgi:hypothetical protein
VGAVGVLVGVAAVGVLVGAALTDLVGRAVGAGKLPASTLHTPNIRETVEIISVAAGVGAEVGTEVGYDDVIFVALVAFGSGLFAVGASVGDVVGALDGALDGGVLGSTAFNNDTS